MRLFVAVLLLPATAFAYGEPDVDGLPNRWERLLHVFTNQARQAPHEWPDWDTSLATNNARPPLAHEPGLAAAGRFHADDMKTHDCFQHESCDGTSFQSRMSRFFSGPGVGENIYSSFGDRSARTAITAWMNSDQGHRENILTPGWTYLGVGWSEKASQIWFVQDFAVENGTTIPMIPAASWEDRGQQIVLIANFWDPEGKAPREMSANVDGAPVAMAHEFGPAGNETLSVTVDKPDDCVELFFVAMDDRGDDGRYPSTGALLFGTGCTSEFVGMASPRPDRIIVDADRPTGCTATDIRHAGLLPVLLLLGWIVLWWQTRLDSLRLTQRRQGAKGRQEMDLPASGGK